ncbi:MAG: TIM barrel protein [Armatimonas sp.]
MLKIRWSVFPKFFPNLSAPELAALVREVGLDTTNLVIRAGFPVTPEKLREQIGPFVKGLRAEGLDITFATTDFRAEDLTKDDTPLALLAENGIKEFRLDHFTAPDKDVRKALTESRGKLERLVKVCERRGVRAIYQLHHGTIVPSPSAVYPLVAGLPARWIGVELDPGNQTHEGTEAWGRSAYLLNEYLVAVAVKDTILKQGANGKWQRPWIPCSEGITDWPAVFFALSNINFDGIAVFMPFYDDKDPAAQRLKLKKEVAFIRSIATR